MFLFVMGIVACKKEERKERFATLRVVNAWAGQDAVKLNVPVSFANSIFIYPKAEELTTITVSSTDDKEVFFSGSYTLKPNIYTMYLCGTALKPDTIFRAETDFPYIHTDRTPAAADSVSHIRFVNLSPAGTIVKIILKDAQNVPALPIKTNVPSLTPPATLGYREISPWRKYPTRAATRTVYNFEVRNAATDELLIANFSLTLTPNSGYFRNISLVIKGVPGGTGKNAFAIFPNNYF
jgi:hypothetical protein